MTIGEIIRKRRKELRMTQDDLAYVANTTKSTVSRWETGDIGKMGESAIEAVSKALSLDPWLFIQPAEVVTRDEKVLLDAYRSSSDDMKAVVRKLLDIPNNSSIFEEEKKP